MRFVAETFRSRRVLLAAVALLSATATGCTYLHYLAAQRDYAQRQAHVPRQHTYKHLLQSPNHFVFGLLTGQPHAVNPEAIAVLAVSDRYQQNEVVDINHVPRIGSYYGLDLPPGRYRLVVVSDLDRDGSYDDTEAIGARDLSLSGSNVDEKVVGDVDIDLEAPFTAPGFEFHIPVKPRQASRESVVYPRGTIRSLDDEIFSVQLGVLGMYEPAAFLERAPMMFYALEEDVAYKIPVVFVHGITGSPRDFSSIVSRLDRRLYRPWFFYYPSGTNLSQLSEFFHRIFLSGKVIPLRGMPMVIVAHSMGGLVVRDALNRYDGTGNGPSGVRWITLASPLGGVPSAASAASAPMTVPSWRDLAPGSSFLQHLHRSPSRAVEYDLLYTRGRKMTSDAAAGFDGVVPVSSELDPAARQEATHVDGFDAEHTEALHDPQVIARILDLVAQVKSPFSNAQLAELVKGGFVVGRAERYTPLERHLIESEGYFLQALAGGSLEPANAAQVHFVDVCRGRYPAGNEAERAWLKFREEQPQR